MFECYALAPSTRRYMYHASDNIIRWHLHLASSTSPCFGMHLHVLLINQACPLSPETRVSDNDLQHCSDLGSNRCESRLAVAVVWGRRRCLLATCISASIADNLSDEA